MRPRRFRIKVREEKTADSVRFAVVISWEREGGAGGGMKREREIERKKQSKGRLNESLNDGRSHQTDKVGLVLVLF